MTSIDIITSGEGNSHEGLRASETFKCHTPFLIRGEAEEIHTYRVTRLSVTNERCSDVYRILCKLYPEIDLYANYFFRSVRTSVTRIEGMLLEFWYNEINEARPNGRAFCFQDRGQHVQVQTQAFCFEDFMTFRPGRHLPSETTKRRSRSRRRALDCNKTACNADSHGFCAALGSELG
jgi:hypothetical protein